MTSVPVTAQLAGKAAARRAGRRGGRGLGVARRPGARTYVVLTLVLLVSLYPLYYSFLLASADAPYIAQHPLPGLIPQGRFLENVRRVLESGIPFWKALANSTFVSAVSAVSVVFFATLAGFAFSKLRFRGKRGLLVVVVATMALPSQLGVIPLFIVMARLGWSGHLIAVIVPALVSAFGVFWMTQYLDAALPSELIDAARVDGASLARTFWSVALPTARPAAAMLALFNFIGHWTSFFWPFIILDPRNPVLPTALQTLQASYFKDYSLVMAGVIMTTIPLLLLFVVAGKQLVAGIMAGAVKG